MKKPNFYTELSYVLGIIFLSLGTSFMTKADFGLSMVVAPAYLIHLKLSPIFSFISFGVASYLFQAVILILLSLILKKFKISYLFSFVTAVVYGFSLDGFILLTEKIPAETIWIRIVLFAAGLLLSTFGISLFFHTYISPEAYDIFVKDLSAGKGYNIGKTKTIYDFSSLAVSVVLSFCFFGLFQFRGIGIGTAIAACVNGSLIAFYGKLLERHFEFKDALPLRKFFER